MKTEIETPPAPVDLQALAGAAARADAAYEKAERAAWVALEVAGRSPEALAAYRRTERAAARVLRRAMDAIEASCHGSI